jgi:hypothetical protein
VIRLADNPTAPAIWITARDPVSDSGISRFARRNRE